MKSPVIRIDGTDPRQIDAKSPSPEVPNEFFTLRCIEKVIAIFTSFSGSHTYHGTAFHCIAL